MQIDAKKLLSAGSAAENVERFNVAAISRIADCTPQNVYLNLKKIPVPDWLLDAFGRWYEANQPLRPADADRLFCRYFADAWDRAHPACPVEVKRGRPRVETTTTDDDPSTPDPRGRNRKRDSQETEAPRASETELPPPAAPLEQTAASRQTIPTTQNSGVITCYGDAVRTFKALASDKSPGARQRRRDFCAAVRSSLSQFAAKPDEEIIRHFRRNTGKTLRQRARDPQVQAKRRRIYEIISGAIACTRKRLTQSKGAYDEHTSISRRKTIIEVLDNHQILAALQNELGEIPTVDYALKLYAEFAGRVDSVTESEDHLTKLLGWRAPWDGYVLVADFTGLDVRVDRHHDTVPIGQKGNRRGFQKLWLGNAVDASSAKNWIYPHFADNEQAGWVGFIEWLYLEQLQYAPPHLVVDRISGVFDQLLDLSVDNKHLSLSPAVALVLLSGTAPYVHQGGRATGGAPVEISNKITKDEARSLLVRRALRQELSGHGLVSDIKRMTQLEFTALLGDLQTRMDQRYLARAGDTRINLWNDADSVAERAKLALVSDAAERWRPMAEQIKVGVAHHNNLVTRLDGEKVFAEINFPEPERVQGWAGLVIPCGLRVNEDSEAKRVLLVEPTKGQPRLHLVSANICKKDKRGWDLRRPIFGEGFIAQPDSQADQFARERDRKDREYRTRVEALRDGTTDEPIEHLED
jgi:hypothetical protein